MHAFAAVALAPALALVACRTAPSERVLYQWSDAEGNVRYTTLPDEVPRSARDTLLPVQPGRTAQENASVLPGARTEPRPPESTREWLRGEAAGRPTRAPRRAPRRAEEAAVPTRPEEIAALDARIRELEQQITEAEVSLAQRMGRAGPDGNPSTRRHARGRRAPAAAQAELEGCARDANW
jgi:hypothetical protein